MTTNKEIVGKFVIVKDLQFSDFMKNEKGEINVYDTYDQAMLVCGMYEFEDVLVMEIKYNYDDRFKIRRYNRTNEIDT